MKRSAVIQFFRKRSRNLVRYRQNILEEFGDEDIHGFRVEVKKLRALLRLVNNGSRADEAVHIGRNLHAFYHAVGDLWELQIQRQVVLAGCVHLKSSVPLSYLEHLREKQALAKTVARLVAQRICFSKLRRHLLKAAKKRLCKKAVLNYLLAQKEQLLLLLANGCYQDEQFHDLRKLVKDLLYIWPLFFREFADVFTDDCFPEQTWRSLAEELGTFQGSCIALAYFKPLYVSNVPAKEYAVLEKLRSYSEGRKERLKEEIAVRLSALRRGAAQRHLFVEAQGII